MQKRRFYCREWFDRYRGTIEKGSENEPSEIATSKKQKCLDENRRPFEIEHSCKGPPDNGPFGSVRNVCCLTESKTLPEYRTDDHFSCLVRTS